MANKTVQNMIDALKTDVDFRQQIQQAATIEERQTVAQNHGFHCSIDDLKSYQRELPEWPEELDDKDLSQVSAGCGIACSGEECHSAQNCTDYSS